MKKSILFFTVLFLCSGINIFAQVVTYNFRDSIGTYNEINGDTIAIATHTSQDPGNLNDVTYGPFALPFIYTFNCIDYTSYFVNSNGFITFGPTAPALANYGPVSSSEVYEGAISAFGLDLIGVFGTTANTSASSPVLTNVANFKGVVVGAHITAATAIPADTYILAFNATAGTITMSKAAAIPTTNLVIQIASGNIMSKTEGISPNRVHTIQFKNFRQYIIIGTNDNFNFQIKLYEPTLTRSGAIHIVYGNMDKNTIPVPTSIGQVGLRGLDNTDYNNRTNSSTLNWNTSMPGTSNAATSELNSTVFPVSGLTYIWDGICGLLPVEMSLFNFSVNRRDVTLNWTTASETNNSHFDVERSEVNGQWLMIGTVKGNGTTVSSMDYSFKDRDLNTGRYNYRLKQTDFNGNFKYYNLNSEVYIGIPGKFDLLQNYPNPFNPSTIISYDLPYDVKLSLKIYDMSGKSVSTIVNEFQTAGYYSINFNGSNLASGMYIYNLKANGINLSKKMLLLK
ncbi:MAG: T9SS type A sorting domain-containing protein [Bacteroidetes bacterium]|nr:T9SS type A sorting domain-containing protein [Bacteroidota bacterium]